MVFLLYVLFIKGMLICILFLFILNVLFNCFLILNGVWDVEVIRIILFDLILIFVYFVFIVVWLDCENEKDFFIIILFWLNLFLILFFWIFVCVVIFVLGFGFVFFMILYFFKCLWIRGVLFWYVCIGELIIGIFLYVICIEKIVFWVVDLLFVIIIVIGLLKYCIFLKVNGGWFIILLLIR